MGCGSSSGSNLDEFAYKGQNIPQWTENNKSLLRKCLTEEVWNKLKDVKDSNGCTLGHIINSGVVNQDSGIGVYAGSGETYTVFKDLLDKIILEYHGHKPEDKHKSNWNVADLDFQTSLDDAYCISTRIRVARNLEKYPFGTFISTQQRDEVEKHAKNAFEVMKSIPDLKGQYYPLGKLTDAQRNQLIQDHFLFKEGDRFLQACGLNRDWPRARGIYHNEDKTFLVWVNEEDQFRIISMQPGGDIRAVFDRLARAQQTIQSQAKFAYNDHLGYLTTCPTNCGTGLRASIHVKLPKLSQNKEQFQKIADQYHVQIRGIHGEHSESSDGVFDISNKRRLGLSEVELVKDMYNGVKAMIEAEKAL